LPRILASSRCSIRRPRDAAGLSETPHPLPRAIGDVATPLGAAHDLDALGRIATATNRTRCNESFSKGAGRFLADIELAEVNGVQPDASPRRHEIKKNPPIAGPRVVLWIG
jgi:hypothetical protein